jgi:hypothetical protein
VSATEEGEPPRKVGRRHKPLPAGDNPLVILARELVALKIACGDPTYKTLAESTHVNKTALTEAGRGARLHAWPIIDGYVRGCWEYYERRQRKPLEGAGDFSRWKQFYRDAGGALPGEGPAGTSGDRPLTSPKADSSAGQTGDLVLSLPARRRRALQARGLLTRRHLMLGAVCVALLITGAAAWLPRSGAGRPSPASPSAVPSAGTDQGMGMVVPVPGQSCDSMALYGFRSPATTMFNTIRTVDIVSLENIAASVMQGTSRGIMYDWVEAHPTGSRAGIQLRWAMESKQWHYCTATVEAGSISALPDLVATIAVPTTIQGHHVIYQACVWHKHPFTEQCSGLL